MQFGAKSFLGVYSSPFEQAFTRAFLTDNFMRRQNATTHPEWVHFIIKLIILVGLTLLLPLFLGVAFDILADSAPLGTLFGMLSGIFLATILIIRTIQTRYLTLAPVSEAENEEKGESS